MKKIKTSKFQSVFCLFLTMLFVVPMFNSQIATAGQGQLNLNTATLEELDSLPGVSPKKAQAIIDHRQKQVFKSVEGLDQVKGFGPKSVEKLKPYLKLEGPSDFIASSRAQTENMKAPETKAAETSPVNPAAY